MDIVEGFWCVVGNWIDEVVGRGLGGSFMGEICEIIGEEIDWIVGVFGCVNDGGSWMVFIECVGVNFVVGGGIGIFGSRVVFRIVIVDFFVGFIDSLLEIIVFFVEIVFFRLFDVKFFNFKFVKILVRLGFFVGFFGCDVCCFDGNGCFGLCFFGFDFNFGFFCVLLVFLSSNGRIFFIMFLILLLFDLVFSVGVWFVGVVDVEVCIVVGFVGLVVVIVIVDLVVLVLLLMILIIVGSIFVRSFWIVLLLFFIWIFFECFGEFFWFVFCLSILFFLIFSLVFVLFLIVEDFLVLFWFCVRIVLSELNILFFVVGLFCFLLCNLVSLRIFKSFW